jgi:putative oxidoreductase
LNGTNAALRNVGWALLRIAMGGFFLTHGYAKVFGKKADGTDAIVSFYDAVGSLGFPYPEFFAWAAALSELAGGALIVLGLWTRPASILAAMTMAVAVYHHADEGFGGMEKALMYLVIFFVFALGGSGPLSIDDTIRARKAKASSAIFR